jgi:hypothetical protein
MRLLGTVSCFATPQRITTDVQEMVARTDHHAEVEIAHLDFLPIALSYSDFAKKKIGNS